MTDVETKAQSAMTFEAEGKRTPEKSAADVANIIAQMEGSLTAIAAKVAKINQDMEALRGRFGVDREPGAPVSGAESESLTELREVIASVRVAAESMPIEMSRAVVTEVGSAVASLATGMEMKMQGLGETAKSLHGSAVAIECDILEARAIHEAHLEVRERWALIVMVISLWFSVVIFLSFGYLWFRL